MSPAPAPPARPGPAVLLVLVMMLGAVAAYAALVWPEWRRNPDLSHGLFAPLIFLLLVWESRQLGPHRWLPARAWWIAAAAAVAAAVSAGLGGADFDAARLANAVLGVFGMMGRLGANVRERQGMAYYAFSRLSADRDMGTWAAIAGVNPANVTRAVAAILDEAKRLQDEPVPADELQDVKRYLIGSLPLQLETNDGVASLLVDLEWDQLGLDYLKRYRGIIEGLTAEQVQAVAQKYLSPEAYALAVAGPDV